MRNETPDTNGNNKLPPPTGENPSNNNLLPPPPPPPVQAQWEQILQRFDQFEHRIKSTIQEEIGVYTSGLQSEVKSINSRLVKVEDSVSLSSNEISRIDHKVSKLSEIKEEVLNEMEKKIASRVASLERELQESKKGSTKE